MNNNNKNIILTGTTGQSASYLAELLLDEGFKVYGTVRRSSTDTTQRIKHLLDRPNFELVCADITDGPRITELVNDLKPHMYFNLAAQSHVHVSYENPLSTIEATGVAVLHPLEAIRKFSLETRFIQASTSELYGTNYSFTPELTHETFELGSVTRMTKNVKYQDESTPFAPNSPYAAAKLLGHNLTVLYRTAYKLHASCGIIFNCESPRRGLNFVTRKVTLYVGALFNHLSNGGTQENFPKLKLGNLDSCRDWSFAGDSVRALYLMACSPTPDDYVVSSGKVHSIREFLNEAFSLIGLDWMRFVEVDPKMFRPNEVPYLRGNSFKITQTLGWTPKTSFPELVKMMVEADIKNGKT